MLLNTLTFNVRHILFLIRGLTLLSKFIFIIFIANHLSVIEVGFYGFIAAAIFLTVFAVGFEYGHHSSRQIIKCPTFLCKQKTVISLTVFGLIMFFIFSPISYYFISSNEINDYIPALYFFIIAYGESYIAEHKKILISLKCPVYSGVVDFVKTGAWAYLLIALVIFKWLELSLTSILFMWALFVVFGCILVFLKLKRYYKQSIFYSLPSFDTYKKQIYSSFPFFLSGLFLLIMEVSGRFSLQMIDLQVEAGVYTFYSGFIFAIPLFVWSASVAFDHAKILEAHEEGDTRKSDDLVIVMIRRSLLICLLLSVFLFIVFDMLLKIVDKEEYMSHINEFYFFLLVPFIHVIDSHLYYMLYARGKDKLIALVSVISLICLITFQIFTVAELGITSIILSIVIALIVSVLL